MAELVYAPIVTIAPLVFAGLGLLTGRWQPVIAAVAGVLVGLVVRFVRTPRSRRD